MSIAPVSAALAIAFSSLGFAQTRVFLGPTPTNLVLDLSQSVMVADPLLINAVYVLMPIQGSYLSFATFDSTLVMNSTFGTGGWMRCNMTALEFAYITDTACAHTAASGQTAPLALVTTDYDFGPYSGLAGTPFVPFPNSTLFPAPFATVSGLGQTFTQEHFQLRTRGFQLNELWNGCPGPATVNPTFTGFLVVRFSYDFV